jgi:uncharacterized membrane protein YkvA (DUF1232 family)
VIRGLIIALLIAAGLWVCAVLALAVAGKRTAARELATFLPNLLLLFRGVMKDPRCPRRSKALLLFAAAWIASPIDLIPEFIPFLGPLDDAVVAALVLRHILKKAGPDVIRDHWRGDPATLDRLLRVSGIRQTVGDS